jgi:MFS family permease
MRTLERQSFGKLAARSRFRQEDLGTRGFLESKEASMNGFETEGDGREKLSQTPAAPNPVEDVRPSSAAIGRTLVVGVLLALTGAWIASALADRFRILETVEQGARRRGEFRGTVLVIGNAARNAAVAYGLLGGILSLSLAATAACLLPRFSSTRILTAGLAGMALGALFGAASSYAVTPLYFNRLGTADVTLSLLIHLAIWSAIGAAAGVAFGLGCGTRKVLAGSLIGGITGGALAALLFDVCGAFLPLAHTERPLAEEADTRLAAAALLSVFVVLGTVTVALQERRAKVPKAVEK